MIAALTPGLLVAANSIVLAGVWLDRWTVSEVVFFFWAENLIVGAFYLARMLSYGSAKALPLSLFFLVHYGGFCAAHGLMLGQLFSLSPRSAAPWPGVDLPLLGLLVDTLQRVWSTATPLWLASFTALVVSHGASFVVNFLLRNERVRTGPDRLMMQPYQRIILLHFAVLLGGIAVRELGEPLLLLLVLVVLKTAVDLRAHLREHAQASQLPVSN
ncbi:MAG: DUF6498-containing protein [Pseudomonadota bacterium]